MDVQIEYKRTPGIIGMDHQKRFAVLIPIVLETDGPAVVFEVRAATLKSQPGEICFPGGSLEAGEEPAEAAVRETREELLVDENQIHLITEGDLFMHPGGLTVYPYLGILEDFHGDFSREEVDEVFTVPLSWFLSREPESYVVPVRMEPQEGFPFERIPGGRDYPWKAGAYEVKFYQYGNHTIWGMTARMMESMAKLLRKDAQLLGRICLTNNGVSSKIKNTNQ